MKLELEMPSFIQNIDCAVVLSKQTNRQNIENGYLCI